MPHMRRGPDTWHVSQTRRCVESSLLSPFKPREPAERRVDYPPPTRAISTRRTCKIDTSPSPEEACWLLFSTCTILRIRHVGLVGRAGALAPRGSRELDTWRTWTASFSLGGRLTWRTSSTSNFAGYLQGNAIEASAFDNKLARVHSFFGSSAIADVWNTVRSAFSMCPSIVRGGRQRVLLVLRARRVSISQPPQC